MIDETRTVNHHSKHPSVVKAETMKSWLLIEFLFETNYNEYPQRQKINISENIEKVDLSVWQDWSMIWLVKYL